MTTQSRHVTVIHTDTESGRFAVLLTDEGQLVYSHWLKFRSLDMASVQIGSGFRVQMGVDKKDDVTPVVDDVFCESSAPVPLFSEYQCAPESCLSADDLAVMVGAHSNIVVIKGAEIEGSELRSLERTASVVFVGCQFNGDFRWLNARFDGGVWFLNCRFKRHFSLKGSHFTQNVVIFGCDFSGPGGVSLRGVHAPSILIEYGTRGGDDMLWLNEVCVPGCVAINGTFSAAVQLLAQQDAESDNSSARIGRLLIGRRAYQNEQLSDEQFLGGITVKGYCFEDGIEIYNCFISNLKFDSVSFDYLKVAHCELARDLSINDIELNAQRPGVSIVDTLIGRNLWVSADSLTGLLCLSGTTVAQTLGVELRSPDLGTPELELRRFHAARAWFEPIRIIYGTQSKFDFLAPPKFRLIKDANAETVSKKQRLELAEAYTMFKNWLAESGHLNEEDHAFFHMRHAKERRLFQRVLLGGIFGWGIRLRNIVFSAICVVAAYALAFTLIRQGDWKEMIMLSAQAFISSFFGDWQNYSVTGAVSVLVTTESVVGVLFITVLIGAYIRKLLR